jgi:hypothetical protein
MLVKFIHLKRHLKADSEKCRDVMGHNPENAASFENLGSKSESPSIQKLHCVNLNFENVLHWNCLVQTLLLMLSSTVGGLYFNSKT